MEILIEASFGKKFKLHTKKDGQDSVWIAMATANAKPGERPYRITWFSKDQLGHLENRHVDLTLEEMMKILEAGSFPPEIIQRIHARYPNDDNPLIADEYVIEPFASTQT